MTPGLSRPCGSNSRLIRHIRSVACLPHSISTIGRHVAPRAVLGLERAVVAPDDDLGDFVHEIRIAADRLPSAKPCEKTKCRFPSSAWPKIIASRITVPYESSLQIGGRRSEALDRHRDIFDDDRRAGRPYCTYRGEQPFPDLPVFFD